MTVANTNGTPDKSKPKQTSHRLARFRRRIFMLAGISFVSYPLLFGVAALFDLIVGGSPRTGGYGFVAAHPIAVPGTYSFVIGLSVSVALYYVFLILDNRTTRSRAKLISLAVAGVISTCFSLTIFSILLIFLDSFLRGISGM